MSNVTSQKNKRNRMIDSSKEPNNIDSKSSVHIYKREEEEDIKEELTKSYISEENLEKIFEKLEAAPKDLFDDEFIETYGKI